MLMHDRWTGMPPTTGDYAIVAKVNAGDEARIWLNKQLVYDTATGKSVKTRLGDHEYADLKVEFVHHGGPAKIDVRWGTDRLVPPHPQDTCHRMPMPRIYPVKAGAGDQLHIVAPKPHQVETKPYGAVIDGKEYVFCSAAEVQAVDGPAMFNGTAGYARENQVALFEGTKIGFQGLVLQRVSGDFGLSVGREADGTLAGRIAGRAGGTVQLTPPAGFDVSRCQVKVNGAVVPHTLEGGAIRFDVRITQADGCKSYTISAN
jgi:hypothetical protein